MFETFTRSTSRRSFAKSSTAAGLSTWLGSQLCRTQSCHGEGIQREAPYKRCITLWMQGGPSQFETFDPKPGTETGGPLNAVSTSVPGVQICETLSGLASRANDFCFLRSVGSKQGEHERATHLLHTGFERIASFPRPSLGSFVSDQSVHAEVPGFVTLGGQVFGPAFLGATNGPFVIGELQQTVKMLRRVKSRSGRLDLISELNARQLTPRHGAGLGSTENQYVRLSQHSPLHQRSEEIDAVRRLIDSPFASSIDLSSESDATKDRYGESEFGKRLLVGRRLLEAGVSYVEVQMPGWDTHVGNANAVKRLCQQVQPAWVALMDDLKASGLWEDTLILWMGEFGRTPGINGGQGRDHYPQSIPVVMAGHSFGGRVIGSTGKDGREHRDESNSVADLMHTLLSLLGIDPEQELTTEFGSPTTATDEGSLIAGVL